MKTLIRCGVLTCAVVLGACSKDTTGPDATPLLNADVATVVADNTGDDVDIMREPIFFTLMPIGVAPDAVGPATGPGNGEFTPPAACTYNATTQRLECPVTSRGSLTVTRSYAFWDANDVAQNHYDAALTAKANIQTHITGDRTGEHWSGSVDRSRDMTVTGLVGDETQRTWNGTGTSRVTRSHHNDNGDRSYDLNCTLTVTNVVVPVPRGDEHFPLSGSITHHCVITFVGGARDGQTVERTATVTFNGTQTANVTVGDRSFDIDLKTRHRGPQKP